jgi:hypothetical protein
MRIAVIIADATAENHANNSADVGARTRARAPTIPTTRRWIIHRDWCGSRSHDWNARCIRRGRGFTGWLLWFGSFWLIDHRLRRRIRSLLFLLRNIRVMRYNRPRGGPALNGYGLLASLDGRHRLRWLITLGAVGELKARGRRRREITLEIVADLGGG